MSEMNTELESRLKTGSVIEIDGTEYTVEEGPWRYQEGKTTRTGYGPFITLNQGNEWQYRCGVKALDFFGFSYKVIKEISVSPPPEPLKLVKPTRGDKKDD